MCLCPATRGDQYLSGDQYLTVAGGQWSANLDCRCAAASARVWSEWPAAAVMWPAGIQTASFVFKASPNGPSSASQHIARVLAFANYTALQTV